MTAQPRFSDVTKNYLARFYEILDEMICGMTGAELTESISHNFIVQMIPHHQAAIEMSKNILQYTTCLPVQQIARNIITEQTKSIEEMQAVLCRCSECMNSAQDQRLYSRRFHQITQTMFDEMRDACESNNINADFMREMIPHHRGAVSMSVNALRYCVCPELGPILDAIITSQEAGIREMANLLKCV